MDILTLEEFIADLETTFSNYAATNDIDRNSVKTWVIDCLRKFGKNICTKNEVVLDVLNSRVLLPETFKSLTLAIKISPDTPKDADTGRKLIVEKQKIENPAYWSDATQDYFANYCQSKITTEKIYTYYEKEPRWANYTWLSLTKGMNRDAIASDCINVHPRIREAFPDQISITQRTLRTNFKEGKIYLQYNSLPSDENGEVAIPIITTGDIKNYIENYVKIKLAEVLGINDKNSQTLSQWVSLWISKERLLLIEAKSEANWSGLTPGWDRKYYLKNRQNQNRYNLPK